MILPVFHIVRLIKFAHDLNFSVFLNKTSKKFGEGTHYKYSWAEMGKEIGEILNKAWHTVCI